MRINNFNEGDTQKPKDTTGTTPCKHKQYEKNAEKSYILSKDESK